ncbi:hypothetical protein HYFRA_00003844 [Hymenoscyphus fraxineus]|uniref:Uncharacterized protein n=1 Tax=Hymenoscyphus fraxineus TaxID=746836 RepID=A0A9N9KZ09_9HELO|nr:hypothetical protein HYFRA_00003844 [Hymenoscyphus fraxineus]
MKFIYAIAACATIAAAIPTTTSSQLEARLDPGQVQKPCQDGGYYYETKKGDGGWTCEGGVNHLGECVYYVWTTTPPYYSCIGS